MKEKICFLEEQIKLVGLLKHNNYPMKEMLQRYMIAAFLFFVFFSNAQSQDFDETLTSAALLSPILKKNSKKDNKNNNQSSENEEPEGTEEKLEANLWESLICSHFEKYFSFLQEKENINLENTDKSASLSVDDCNNDNKVWISDTVAVDAKWFYATDHYHLWDTRNVNPYEGKIADLKDSIDLELFNYNHSLGWSSPLCKTKTNSDFGMRRYRWHYGIDLDLEVGDPVYAVFDGIVRIAKFNRGGYGYYVLLRHANGLETIYGHLSKYHVKPGDVVKAGQVIGLGGNTGRSTGPHLHFETRYKGHAFNPDAIFDFENDTIKTQKFTLTKNHYKDLLEREKAVFYKVRSGDTLGKISARYGISVKRIMAINNMRSSSLSVGRSLRVR